MSTVSVQWEFYVVLLSILSNFLSWSSIFLYHYSLNSDYISHDIYFTAEGVCMITDFHISETTKQLSWISTWTAKACQKKL